MALIEGPKVPESHPDRALACEQALEARFLELLDTGDVNE
ncbi:hypothetical protein C7476_12448 [Phyllobacterium bourgognense]|uniref:Uncharacterized protein n=1 Tax=Phyllobacterium bourgognense TaxID=314236 RepID=A0A368YI19_9HYPH|nr:hypothetical protein C7476_12448 [Phyllobacterium bourgognense]